MVVLDTKNRSPIIGINIGQTTYQLNPPGLLGVVPTEFAAKGTHSQAMDVSVTFRITFRVTLRRSSGLADNALAERRCRRVIEDGDGDVGRGQTGDHAYVDAINDWNQIHEAACLAKSVYDTEKAAIDRR